MKIPSTIAMAAVLLLMSPAFIRGQLRSIDEDRSSGSIEGHLKLRYDARAHPQILAFKLGDARVLASASPGDNGDFEIKGLLPGEYQIKVYLNYCAHYEITVRVKLGKTKRITIGRAQEMRPNLCE